jgi:NAD-dependent SIR2 family protein deacetylase
LLAANAGLAISTAVEPVARPDGDRDVDDAFVDAFLPVQCDVCGGSLKPRVVYFGENVPAADLASARAVLDDADALLVVGSSLEVFSGRRFVDEAHRRGLPIVIVNESETRADDKATVLVRGRAGAVLPPLLGSVLG